MKYCITIGLICFKGFCDLGFRIKAWLRGRERWNGNCLSITLGEVYQRYLELHVSGLSPLTAQKKKARFERTLSPLFDVRMAELNPDRITEFLKNSKGRAALKTKPSRCGFQKELVDLQQLFTWWADHFDFRFRNPVRPFHKRLAVISEVPIKERKITLGEVHNFLEELPLMYRDMATLQFYCGARIGEIAGIQVKNIDLEKRILTIREVMTWINGKPFVRNLPKTGEVRHVFLNATMLEIITRRLACMPKGCRFLFNDEGEPLRYNRINENYNRAWKRARLEKFKGTHQLRYAAAQAAVKVMGSIEASAAVTGHRCKEMAEKYAIVDDAKDLNRDSLRTIEVHMREFEKNSDLRRVAPDTAYCGSLVPSSFPFAELS